MMKGIFCISIDTELLWGRKDLDYSAFVNRTKKERKIIREFIRLFSRYNIPVTWAIVGKLYEDGGRLWSGKDIISWIKKEKIHELASHSYSHEDFANIDKNKANLEFSKPKGYSFVFPRNHIRYLGLLRRNGFKAYRDKDKFRHELLLPKIPYTGKAIRQGGLVKIPSSMYFVSARGWRRYIPRGLRFLKCKLGIDQAIRRGEIFHIWFHPVDFADNTTGLMKEFEMILAYAYRKRGENKLDIMRMSDI